MAVNHLRPELAGETDRQALLRRLGQVEAAGLDAHSALFAHLVAILDEQLAAEVHATPDSPGAALRRLGFMATARELGLPA